MRTAALIVLSILTTGSAAAQEAILELGPGPTAATATLTMHGSTDIDVFTPVLKGFAQASPGLRIVYEQRSTNDIYQLADGACADGKSGADLLISSSIDQQIKLVNDGCAQPHSSPGTEALPAWSKWRDEIFGLTYEPAVMIYNKEMIKPEEVPRSRFDLIDLLRASPARFARRVATYDIEESGFGYLMAFADAQQATTYGRLIEAFGRSQVVATCCSAEIIDAVAEGAYLIAYNMLGSYALARAARDPRIGIVAPADYTLILARAALVPKSAANVTDAKRFIDYALSPAGRNLLAETALIVRFDDRPDEERPRILTGSPPNLLPLTYSPAQLVGLDRQKRKIFIRTWRSSIKGKATADN